MDSVDEAIIRKLEEDLVRKWGRDYEAFALEKNLRLIGVDTSWCHSKNDLWEALQRTAYEKQEKEVFEGFGTLGVGRK